MQTKLSRSTSQIIAVPALILLLLGALWCSPQLYQPTLALIAVVSGSALLWLTFSRLKNTDFFESKPSLSPVKHQPFRRWRWVVIAMGIVCLLFMAQGGSPPDAFWTISDPLRTDTQFLLFCAGVALVSIGFMGVPSRRKVSGASRSQLTLVFIILLGFAVRIVNLENELHYFLDEMHFSDGITHLWKDPYTPIFTPINWIASFSWLYPFLQKFSVDIFGANLTGLRMVSVVFGTLTIPAVYLLGRWLFDRPTALIAALLLAIFPPHIHFSRLALNNIADPFFGTLALAFLARGLNRRDRASFVIAGVCLGMTQYFYEGGKLIFPPIVAMWMLWILVRQPHNRRENLRAFGVLIAVAFLVILPLMMMLGAWQSAYIPRSESQALSGNSWKNALATHDVAIILNTYWTDKLQPAIEHIISTPDTSEFYYGGNTALILPMLLPAFFVGVVYVVWRRRVETLILPAVIILAVFGNSLIENPGWTPRYVVAFPALCLLIAVGVRVLWRYVSTLSVPSGGRMRQPIASFGAFLGINSTGWIAPTLLITLSLLSLTYYFFPHMTSYNQQIRTFNDHQDVGWRVNDLPEGTHVYLFTIDYVFLPHYSGMENFWKRPLNITLVVDGQINFSLEEVSRQVPIALFVMAEDAYLISDLDFLFGLPEPQYSPYNVPIERQYILYYLPALSDNSGG
ncbi:MAG: glycosyltransferase family 39 protein [Aggregatilineales bacterium]